MKYREKVIEAWQFTKENYKKGKPDICYGRTEVELWSKEIRAGIETLSGEVKQISGRIVLVKENDWIIKGVLGDFYACNPEVFEMKYIKESEEL